MASLVLCQDGVQRASCRVERVRASRENGRESLTLALDEVHSSPGSQGAICLGGGDPRASCRG